jgi:hypothetical protein
MIGVEGKEGRVFVSAGENHRITIGFVLEIATIET